jgi:hypothetical protein
METEYKSLLKMYNDLGDALTKKEQEFKLVDKDF